MLNTGNVRDLQPLQMAVGEKAAVDDQYDTLFQIGLDGLKSQGFGQNGNVSETTAWSSSTEPAPTAHQ